MDQFEKIKTLGRGAQGTVVLVRRKADRAKFCIKKIYIEDQTMEDQEAVMNEIKVGCEVDTFKFNRVIPRHSSWRFHGCSCRVSKCYLLPLVLVAFLDAPEDLDQDAYLQAIFRSCTVLSTYINM